MRISDWSSDVFSSDLIRTQDAVVRNLEILGEAAKRLSPEFRAHHPQIEWSQIAGMRDRLIHHYFGVNWEIVWNVVQERLPDLIEHLDLPTDDPDCRLRARRHHHPAGQPAGRPSDRAARPPARPAAPRGRRRPPPTERA